MSGDNFSLRYAIVAEARRRWSDAEKQAIIAEAARPDTNILAVARRHGIKPNLLFRWRRIAREDGAGDLADGAGGGEAHRRVVRYQTRHQRIGAPASDCGSDKSKAHHFSPPGNLAARAEVPAFTDLGMENLREIMRDQIDKAD